VRKGRAPLHGAAAPHGGGGWLLRVWGSETQTGTQLPALGPPGLAQSRLRSSADGPANHLFLHCLVEEFACAVCEARHQSINPQF